MGNNRYKKYVEQSQKIRKILLIVLMLFIIVYFAYLFMYGEKGYMRYQELKATQQHLNKEIRHIELEKKQTLQEIHVIRKDPYAMEGHARSMGYQQEGEIIYKFKE